MRAVIILIISTFLIQTGQSQKYQSSWLLANNLSNPLEGRRSFDISGQSFIYGKGEAFFAGRLAFYYSFGKDRKHFAGAEVPFVLSDYSGMDTKMGLGDIRLRYHYYAYRDNSGDKSFETFGLGVETFAPTGKEEDGLSRGNWVVYLNAMTAFRLGSRWAIYPVARYIFSFDSTYSINIAGPPFNVPQPPSEDNAEIVSAIQADAMVVYEMPKVAAFIGISPEFLFDTKRNAGSFALLTKLGKMFNEKFGISVAWAIQVAGQRSYKNAFHLGLISYLK
jgi:hypothetical protein